MRQKRIEGSNPSDSANCTFLLYHPAAPPRSFDPGKGLIPSETTPALGSRTDGGSARCGVDPLVADSGPVVREQFVCAPAVPIIEQ